MTDTDDLIAFLRARLDEDEQVAKAAASGPWSETGRDSVGEGMVHSDSTGWAVVGSVKTGYGPDAPYANVSLNAAHIARHDPARALREVTAKRRIVDAYAEVAEFYRPDPGERYETADGHVAALHDVVRDLASVYGDHPDYRSEWAPDAEIST